MSFHPDTRVRYRKDKRLDVQPFSYLTELYKAVSKPIIFTSYGGLEIPPQEANAIDVGIWTVTSNLLQVTFSDGSKALCSTDQLWGVYELEPRESSVLPVVISPINSFVYTSAANLRINDKIRALTQEGFLRVLAVEAYPVTFIELHHARVPSFGNYYVVLENSQGEDVEVVAGHLITY